MKSVAVVGIAGAALSGCAVAGTTAPSGAVADVAVVQTAAAATLLGESPRGNFESAAPVAGGVQVKGWMLDPDTTDPIYAWVTVDGVGRHLYANASRSDVGNAFPGYGSNHGFQATIPASPGSHRVCVTASNTGPGSHTRLGCRTVSVADGSPVGDFEAAAGVAGGIEVTGWMADPSAPTMPIYAWVTVDGRGRHLYANRTRSDVGDAHPGYGPDHGFHAVLPASPGDYWVCVTAANIGPGSHTSLGCWTAEVPDPSPFGNFESARGTADSIEIKGWMADPSAPTTPLYAWVTIDGAGQHLYANDERADVGNAFPGYGSNHGFRATIPDSPGIHRVCVTAANIGPGTHTSLGCRTTRPPTIDTGGTYEILVAENAGLAFVSDGIDSVAVIDTATNTVTATLDAGYSPGELAYDPLAGRLYVAGFDGVLRVFDVATHELVDTIDTGGEPWWGLAGVNPAGERAYFYVADGIPELPATWTTSVGVVDTATGTILENRTYPGGWGGTVHDPDADLLYVQSGWQVLVIDLATLEIVAEIPTGFTESQVHPMAIDLEAGVLYASEAGGPLHLIDTTTHAVIASIPLGSGDSTHVTDVVLDHTAGLAYAVRTGSGNNPGQIDVIDTTSHTVIDTIDIGGRPWNAALDDTSGTLYVVDNYNDTVSHLRLR